MKKKTPLVLLFLFWALPAFANVDTAWVRRFNGSGDFDDVPCAIAVDGHNNVYVTGQSYGVGTDYDYVTIKYYPNGDTAWLRRYDGPSIRPDFPTAMAIDSSGNAYVTGHTPWHGCTTIKYRPNGDTAWLRVYHAWNHDEPRAITLDDSGNIYIAGYSQEFFPPDGWLPYYFIIKYYPDGDVAWATSHLWSRVNALAVDHAGSAYVGAWVDWWPPKAADQYTEESHSGSAGGDCVVIKHYPNGDTAWTSEGTHGYARDIVVDSLGNAYVTGYDGTTKFEPEGNVLWGGPAGADIALDNSGHIYLAGERWQSGASDFMTTKYHPGGDTAWVRTYNGPGNHDDVPAALVVDGLDNVYVTGHSWSTETGADHATVKYDSDGSELWVQRYAGPSWMDAATAIALDSSGAVCVTGWSYGPGEYDDLTTIKYHPDGDTMWVRRHNGGTKGWDRASDTAIDEDGNLHVTGVSYGCGTDADIVVIKYHPDGDTAWARLYDSPGDGYDSACAVVVDGSGKVCVTGIATHGAHFDFITMKYHSNGELAWTRRYAYDWWTQPYGLTVDDSGCVYVTGGSKSWSSNEDYATIKYHPNGDTAWIRRYDALNFNDRAEAIAVDSSGNVYVTGGSGDDGGTDYATIKYYPNGDTAWVRRFDGTGNWNDRARAITVDDSGSVYVTGPGGTIKYDAHGNQLWTGFFGGIDIALDVTAHVYVTGTIDDDYVTVGYHPDGDTAWLRTYDGPGNARDSACAIDVDGSGNVYVTGETQSDGIEKDYATVKYDSLGNEVWVRMYDGPISESDAARAIAIDDSGYVYVTGTSYDGGAYKDFVTIKYIQSSDVEDENGARERPSEFALSQNYPNPFNQSTKIEFALRKSGFVSLILYDLLGRKVRTLVSERLIPGYKSVLWDGKNDSGDDVASGIYFYQLKVGDFSETKKLVLLK